MRILLPLIPLILVPSLARAQGGDPWERMQRYDANKDGKVTRAEFQGPDRVWQRMDANGDGEVTREEAGRMRRRGRNSQDNSLTRSMDADKDGKVSKAEWDAYFKKHDENADGQLDADEMRAAIRGRAYEDRAPKVGSPAPKVTVTAQSDGSNRELAKFTKPTVLVFGSWT